MFSIGNYRIGSIYTAIGVQEEGTVAKISDEKIQRGE
jgi:hypothetical protein